MDLGTKFVLALVAAEFGDYVLQSDWMAQRKTKSSVAAFAHVLTYTLPFVVITFDWRVLTFIAVTHFVIDRWRLARYVAYAKNFLAPCAHWHPWSECQGTGYHQDSPPWLSVWLMIRADNAMHHACNLFAIWMWS